MKELSIEKKAKRYDEVVEKFDVILNLNTVKESGTIFADDVRKILPELKESEDEKIKEQVIYAINQLHVCDCTKNKLRAWLEKQGEHSNFLNKIQIGDKVTRNKDGFLVNLSQVNRAAKPTNEEQKDILEDAILDGNEDGLIAETIRYKKEKQGEQKSEEEVDNLHNYLYGKQKLSNNQFTPKQAGVFDKHIDKFLEQKLAWSKEDESLYDYLFGELNASLKDYCGAALKDMKKAIEWFKSLKDRVQPKQEWSEDDKGNLLDVKCIIDEIWHNQDVREEINHSGEELESLWHWLDNIWQRVEYPQNHWKPSKTQMKALKEACDEHWEPDGLDPLYTLYQDLKKLIESYD